MVPMRRVGEPTDIADVVSFLVSDAARYVTGQVIYVCGGVTASHR
jgi:3-oxoacyl-[acyl-carrier protein] reductase